MTERDRNARVVCTAGHDWGTFTLTTEELHKLILTGTCRTRVLEERTCGAAFRVEEDK